MAERELYITFTSPLGDDLMLQNISGEERMSGMFRFQLGLVSAKNDISFESIVGEKVTVSMTHGDGNTRYINGVVGRFVQSGTDQRYTTYYAEVYPMLWKLTMAQDSRIFQNLNVPDILSQVFGDFEGLTFRDDGCSCPVREYCVQYQETAFNFVSRLMEEEGIFYYFEHATADHTLVFNNNATQYPAMTGLTTARLNQSDATRYGDDVLSRVTLEQRMTVGKYSVDDFNFETPSLDLMVETSAADDCRFYEYPAGFAETADGQDIAARRLEAFELPTKLLRGEGFCKAFTPGYKFTLEEHGRTDINGDYVISSVRHHASKDGYRNSFVAFPSDKPFRPPFVARKPRIYGTQSAIVVGPSGQEIHTDQYGRVKVQFHWDQLGANDENSSCFIRVAQGWAGKGWGNIFIPRIGQEVLVSHLNGDPDCPIITGSVYNAEQTVPYALPDNQTKSAIKTQSTMKGTLKTFNEIRFEDKKGSEEFYIHAEKDMNVMVENNRTTTIGDMKTATTGHETTTIKGNRTTTIKEGNDKLVVVKGNRNLDIQKGTDTYHVKGNRTVNLDTNETRTIKKNFTQTVKKNYTLNVHGDLTIDVKGKVTIKSGKDMLLDSKGKFTAKSVKDGKVQGKNITVQADMKLTNKAGTKLVNQGASVTNDASGKLENKAGGMHDVTAGGILKIAGSLVKIN